MGIPPIRPVQKPAPILDAVRKAREALLRRLRRKKAIPTQRTEETDDGRGRHVDKKA